MAGKWLAAIRRISDASSSSIHTCHERDMVGRDRCTASRQRDAPGERKADAQARGQLGIAAGSVACRRAERDDPDSFTEAETGVRGFTPQVNGKEHFTSFFAAARQECSDGSADVLWL